MQEEGDIFQLIAEECYYDDFLIEREEKEYGNDR